MEIVGELVIVAAGVLVIVIGRLTATGRIGRNPFAGIRTKRTMADAESWRIVHRGAQPWTIAAGAVLALVGLIALVVPDEAASAIVIGVGTGLAIVLTLLGTFTGLRALNERTL
ncbi:SdpI family protein [Spirillospora sp. NPDC052242]